MHLKERKVGKGVQIYKIGQKEDGAGLLEYALIATFVILACMPQKRHFQLQNRRPTPVLIRV